LTRSNTSDPTQTQMLECCYCVSCVPVWDMLLGFLLCRFRWNVQALLMYCMHPVPVARVEVRRFLSSWCFRKVHSGNRWSRIPRFLGKWISYSLSRPSMNTVACVVSDWEWVWHMN
jgi:hypothetical protein